MQQNELNNTFVIKIDEVGSTERDEKSKDVENLLGRRAKLFGWVIGQLAGACPAIKVIKNVGDELVIRCDKEGDVGCLLSTLVTVIENSKKADDHGAVRIAVHGNDCCVGFKDGTEVDNFMEKMAAHAGGVQIAEFTKTLKASLEHDVFGPTINRVSRLAKASDEAILLVSEKVHKLFDKLRKESNPAVQGIEESLPVPLFALKGIGEFDYGSPWVIYQLRTARTGADTPRHDDLEMDGSSYQALREVHLQFYGAVAEGDPQYGPVKEKLKSWLVGNPVPTASSYCVDALFEVSRQWRAKPYPTTRLFAGQLPKSFKFEEIQLKTINFRPVFLAFTSVLDEKHDRVLRDILAKQASDPGADMAWTASVVTNYVYERGTWLPHLLHGSEMFALIRCLVAAEYFELAEDREKWPQLFSQKPRPLPTSMPSEHAEWKYVGYGALRGSTDAYLLYHYVGDDAKREALGSKFVKYLRDAVVKAHKGAHTALASAYGKNNFELFGRIIPVTVDLLFRETTAMQLEQRREKFEKVLCRGSS